MIREMLWVLNQLLEEMNIEININKYNKMIFNSKRVNDKI